MSTMRVRGTLDTREYERGVQRMKGKNREFGRGVDGIKSKLKKAFAVAAIIAFVRQIARGVASLVQFGSKLSDMAAQTGMAVESFQRLQRAVRDAGGEDQHLVNALARIKTQQGEVINGNQKMIESLARLGVSADDFVRMDVEQAFVAISKGLTDSGNSADAFSAAVNILGQRNVPKLLEAMNAAAGGVDKLGEGLRIMSERDAQALDVLADKLANVGNNIKTFFATGVARVARSLFGEGDVDARIASQARMKELEERARIETLATAEREKQAEIAAKIADEERKLLDDRMTAEARIRDQREAGIKRIEESARLQIDTDPVRRMGGFAGAMVSEQLMIARRQADIQASIRDFTATLPQIENNTRERGLR